MRYLKVNDKLYVGLSKVAALYYEGCGWWVHVGTMQHKVNAIEANLIKQHLNIIEE